MSFTKGQSGNPKGRPRQTEEQKRQREKFQALLRASTVDALEGIIQIAHDRHSRDRLNACKFLIEKAYGSNTALLMDDIESVAPVVIEIRPWKKEEDDDWGEDSDDMEDG